MTPIWPSPPVRIPKTMRTVARLPYRHAAAIAPRRAPLRWRGRSFGAGLFAV